MLTSKPIPSRTLRDRPWSTACSTRWRSTSGRKGHYPGTRRSAIGSATSDGSSPYPRRPPPRARISTCRPRTESTCRPRTRRRRRRSPAGFAASYAHQERGCPCAQGLGGPAPALLLCMYLIAQFPSWSGQRLNLTLLRARDPRLPNRPGSVTVWATRRTVGVTRQGPHGLEPAASPGPGPPPWTDIG